MAKSVTRMGSLIVWLSLVCGGLGADVHAQVPALIRFQGQAVDSQGVPLEGPYTLTFRLYDAATAGTLLWQEPQNNVTLSKGHFSVLLGQGTPLTGMSWSQPYWLSIQVGAQPELAPRQQFTSVPMALRADTAEHLTDISASVSNSANISIATSTNTILPFDSETFDTDTMHDPAPTLNSRLTFKTPGKYLVTVQLAWETNNTGTRELSLRLNGTTSIAYTSDVLTTSICKTQTASAIATFAATDYVEVMVKQTSGSSQGVLAPARFTATKLN